MANKLNRLLSSKERRYKPVASTTSPNKDTTNPTKTPSSESKDASTRIVSTKGSPADISSSSLLNRQNTHGSRLRDDNTETIKRRKSRRMSDKAKSTDSPTARTVETTVYTAKYNGRVSQVDYNDAKKDDQYGVKRERRNSTSSKFNEKSTKSGRSTSRGSRHDNKLSDSDRWSSIPDKLFRKNPLSRKLAISDNDNKREKERGNESEKNNRTSDARDMSGNKSSGRLSSKELRGEKDKSTPRGKPKKEDDKKSSKTKSVKEEDDIVKKKLSSSSSRLTPSAFLKRSQSTKAFKDSSFDLDRSRSKHKPSNKVSEHSSSKRGKDLDKSSSSHAKGGREESLSSSTRGLIQCHTLPDDFAIPPKSSTYRRVDTQSRSKSSHVDRKDDKLVSSHTSRPKSLSRSIHSNASSRDREDCPDAATAAGRATVTGLEIVPRLTSPSDDNMQVGLEIIPMKQPNHANCRETQDKRKSSSSSHHPRSHRRGSSAGTSDTGMTRRKSEIDLLTSQVSLLDFNSSNSHNDNKADDDDDDKNVEDDSGKRRDKEKDRSSFTLTNHDASSRSGMSKTAMSNEKNKRLIKSSINKNTSGRNDIIRKNSYKPKNRSVHLERIDPKSRNISSSQKDDDMSLGTILDKRLNQRRSWSASPPRGMTTDGKKGEEKINNNLQSKRKEPIEPNIPGSSSTQALAPSRVETNNPSRSRQFREGHARRPGHHRRLSGLQRRNSKMRSISPSTRSRDQRNEDKKPSAGPHDAQPPCAKSLADSTLIVREDRKSVSRPMQDGRHHDDDRIRRSGPFRRPSLAQRRHSNKYSNELSDHRDRSQSEGKRRYEGERATSNGSLHGPYLAQRWQSKGDSRPLSMLKDESYSEDEVEASPGLRPAHLTRRNSRTLNITSPTSNNESSTLASPLSPQSRQEGVRVTNFGRHPRAPRDVREINTLKSENKSRDEGVRHNRPIRRTTVAHAPDDKLNTSLRSGDSKGNPRHEIESGNHLASMPNILGDDGSQATDKAQPSIISPDYEKIKRLCESIQRQQNMVNSKSNKPTTGKGLDDNALKDLRPLYKDSSALKLEANEVKSLPQPILRHSRIARIPTISPPMRVPPPPPPPRKSISEGEALPQNAVLHSGASETSGVNQGACSGSPPPQPMSQKVNGNEQLSSFPQNSTTQHVIPASGLPSQTIDPRIINNGPSPANTMNSAPERSLQRSNSSNTIGDTARQARNRKLMALAGGGEKQRVAGLSYNDRVGGRGLYTGEVDQWGRPNGEGKIEYDSGEMFEGQWVNGNRVAPTFCPPTGAPIIPGGSLAPNGGASVAPGSVAPGMYGGGASVAPGSIMGGMYGGGGFMMNPFAQAQFMQQQRMTMGYPMMMQGQGQAMMQHPAQIMYPQMMPRPQFPGQQQQPNQTEDQDSV